ncbi:MAG TPA: ABC transporter permease [Bryobacteraceae bacterium]|nr:ABC transporter permease [Bryobacteraceae bacterium]
MRYAIRTLRKNPGFALVAIVSLALGIGANAAMFSFADAIVLRPLPVPDASGVVMVQSLRRGDQIGVLTQYARMSYPDYADVRDRSQAFAGLTASRYGQFGFTAQQGALPRMEFGELVSGNFFSVLGVQPVLGRGFRPEEDRVRGRDAVVVISYGLWKREFGGSPDAVGRQVFINGIAFTMVGVAPEAFLGSNNLIRSALFVPMAMAPRLGESYANQLEGRDDRNLTVRGRLKPGAKVEQANAEAGVISRQLAQAYPKTNSGTIFSAAPDWRARLRGDAYDSTIAGILLALAAMVLGIACANVANLMLSRAGARSREIAVRLAIGAGRGRLVRQLLTESVMIAVLGGAAGLLIASNGVDLLAQYHPPSPVPLFIDARLDLRVVVFALAATAASVLLFGLVPAIQATRSDLVPALKSGKGGSGRRRFLGRNALVTGQVAGSLVLLVFATQAYRGAVMLFGAPPGFRTGHLLIGDLDPGLARYTPAQSVEFYRKLLDRAKQMPGVVSAALADDVPMGLNGGDDRVAPEGFRLPPGTDAIRVSSCTVTEDYFRTMEIPIVRGRGFETTDGPNAPRVTVVNESFARKYYPGKDVLGKRFRLDGPKGPLVVIVGVARQSKYSFIAEPETDYIYVPFWQRPHSDMTVLLETSGPPGDMAEPLRQAVRSLDPRQPLFGVTTMQAFFDARERKIVDMLVGAVAAMGLLGLALALVGLYGLMAYSVGLREREIGIRMAIGADPHSVLWMVLRQGAGLAGAGAAIGLALSLAAGRPALSVLEVRGFNLPLVGLVTALLLGAAGLGAYAPARRAARVDPNVVLREE